MKRLVLVFVAVVLISHVAAQTGSVNSKEALRIKNSMLIVLLENDETPYNKAIQYAVETCWKFSTFKFIKPEELYLYCKPGFTVLTKYSVIDHYRQKYIGIVFPDQKRCEWNNLELQAYSYCSFNPDLIGGNALRAVQFIQNYLNLVLDKKFGQLGLKTGCKLCNGERNLIKQKMLYVNDGETMENLINEKVVGRYYRHPLKMASLDDINQAILGQREEVAYIFNFKDLSGDIYRMVVQARDSKILYCKHSEGVQYTGFEKSHFKAISK